MHNGERVDREQNTQNTPLYGVTRSSRGQSRRVPTAGQFYETPSGMRAKADCRKQG